MTQIQLDSLNITDLPAARALRQNSDFLAHFIAALSPSDVAPRLGMAANLAHHHARKLADLGLLFERGRGGGKVLYQLAAREFRVPSELLPPEDEAGNGSANMRELSAGFLHAYERSWGNMQAGQEDVYGFGDLQHPAKQDKLSGSISEERYPTHADTLTLRLSTERFAQLARALSKLLDEAGAEGHSEGDACTFAVLAFAASDQTEGRRLSRATDSYLGWSGAPEQ